MAQAVALSADLSRQAVGLARALTAGVRVWALYPPEHPSVGAAVRRVVETIREVAAVSPFGVGVTPSALVIGGVPLQSEGPVADAAQLLHDHDILQISFLSEVQEDAARALLTLLATSADDIRA